MLTYLKRIAAAGIILGLWGVAFVKLGNAPPEAPDREPSPSASAEAVPSARRPRRPTDPLSAESEADRKADLARQRAREAANGPGAAERAVDEKLDDLKTSLLGKEPGTRGEEVRPPRLGGVPKRLYDYTPREVCVQMKLDYPEQYADMDCSDDSFDSPFGWRENMRPPTKAPKK